MAICDRCGTNYQRTREQLTCPNCSVTEAQSRAKPVPAQRPATRAAPSPAAARTGVAVPAPRAPAAAARPKPAARAPEPEHHHRSYQAPPTLDKSTRIGLLVAGGFAVVVLLVVFVVMGKKGDERKAREAYEKEITDLHSQLAGLDTNDEASAARLLAVAKEKEARWKDHELARDIQSLVSKAALNLETGESRREVVAQFTGIEEKLKAPENLSPETIKDLRRQLDEIELKISLGGPELLARFALQRGVVDQVYANRLLQDAQSYEQANADNPRLALSRYQQAEDEIKVLFDRAHHQRDENLQGIYRPLYQQAIEQSDRLVGAIFTAEASQKLAVIDCLSGEQVANWNPSAAKGFSHRIDGGVLQIVGPDPDAGQMAVISIGDLEQWRNFIADFEFTIEKGNLEMFFRLGRVPNANTISHALKTEGETPDLKAGKTYQARMSLLGSRFTFRFGDEGLDTPPGVDGPVEWYMSRKGAIGLLVPPGTRVRFTKFQVRELR